MDFPTNDRVSITLEDDGVAQVRFVRADKMNALDHQMFETMIAAAEALGAGLQPLQRGVGVAHQEEAERRGQENGGEEGDHRDSVGEGDGAIDDG